MTGDAGTRGVVTWTRPAEAIVLCLCGATMRTAAPVALIVGTILSLINQGHLVFTGTADAATWIRVAVNYLVPFLVASIGFLSARRVRVPAATTVSTPEAAAHAGPQEPGSADDPARQRPYR